MRFPLSPGHLHVAKLFASLMLSKSPINHVDLEALISTYDTCLRWVLPDDEEGVKARFWDLYWKRRASCARSVQQFSDVEASALERARRKPLFDPKDQRARTRAA